MLDGKNEYFSYKMWEGSDIIFPDRVGNFFVYTTWKLGSSLSCKLPIYIYIYIYVYVYVCVWGTERGGGHGCITDYAGHIIHQSTWQTVFGGERWKIWKKWRYSSVLQYKPRFSSCSAYAPLLCRSGATHACGVKRALYLTRSSLYYSLKQQGATRSNIPLKPSGITGEKSFAGVVQNSDPCQIITPPSIGRFRVRGGGGVRIRGGLGLGNQIAISTRGGNNLAGVENGHNTGTRFLAW